MALAEILEWRDPSGLRGCGFFHVPGGKIVFQRGYGDNLPFLRLQGLPLPGPLTEQELNQWQLPDHKLFPSTSAGRASLNTTDDLPRAPSGRQPSAVVFKPEV
jgi:hypothetical protein